MPWFEPLSPSHSRRFSAGLVSPACTRRQACKDDSRLDGKRSMTVQAGKLGVADLILAWAGKAHGFSGQPQWALDDAGVTRLSAERSTCFSNAPHDEYKIAIFKLLGDGEKGPIMRTDKMEEFVWCKLKLVQMATSKSLIATHPLRGQPPLLEALQKQIEKNGESHFTQGGNHYNYVYVLLLSKQARAPNPSRLLDAGLRVDRAVRCAVMARFRSSSVRSRTCGAALRTWHRTAPMRPTSRYSFVEPATSAASTTTKRLTSSFTNSIRIRSDPSMRAAMIAPAYSTRKPRPRRSSCLCCSSSLRRCGLLPVPLQGSPDRSAAAPALPRPACRIHCETVRHALAKERSTV